MNIKRSKNANFIDIGKYIDLIKIKDKKLHDEKFIKIAKDFLKKSKPICLTGNFDKDLINFNKFISDNIFNKNNLKLSSTDISIKNSGEVWIKIEETDDAYFIYTLNYLELIKNILCNKNCCINIKGEIKVNGKITEVDLNNFKEAQKIIENKIYK